MQIFIFVQDNYQKHNIYKYVSTCTNINNMGKDRKRMRKIREKRINSVQKQIEKHEYKIKHEKGRKDTTKDYWQKEIDEKFMKQLKEDEEYLDENK